MKISKLIILAIWPTLFAQAETLVDTKDFTPEIQNFWYQSYESLRAQQTSDNPLLHLTNYNFNNYDLGDRPALTAATDKFGAVVIDMKKLPLTSEVLDSGMKPWSSWWYPKVAKEFTQSQGINFAILDKFDRFYSKAGTSESALTAERETERLAGSPVNWEGLCDAWAIASIVHKEPRFPVAADIPGGDGTTNTINFSISDLKGLLLKTYEAVDQREFDIFGEKFLGNKTSWIHPDLFPDQFHRIVEIFLGEKKQAFLMDHDPGIEVWNIPVYKAYYKIERVPGDPKSVSVRLWLFTAAPAESNQKNAVGTKELIKEYNYILTGDLSYDKSKLTVKSGRWMKSSIVDSEANHPDYVLVPKSRTVARRSYNKLLSPEKVDFILKNSFE